MAKRVFEFAYSVLESADELNASDRRLLDAARQSTELAYAPYSSFHVGAAALLEDGTLVKAANQENASFPAGICAERVLLSAVASQFPNVVIRTIAISYHNRKGLSNEPVSPCGICRQSLLEYEGRNGSPIRIILSGLEGGVIVIDSAVHLLPFAFSSTSMR